MLRFSIPTTRPIRVTVIFLALFAIKAPFSLAQNHPDKMLWMEKLDAIRFEPLELLPLSDCRLNDLESEIFRTYTAAQKSIPADLAARMQQQRERMDFMRGHIDSLYYLQALQTINKPVPDWEAAEAAIEKALLHNRFFDRAVVFKMNNLLHRKRNAQILLRYLNTVLKECSYPARIRQMAQTVYLSLLKETEKLIENKQYHDALDLCLLLRTYCQPGFPIRYIPYKEKTLENLARQGIFLSHCEVAQKAFDQKQYQLAQKYALQAYDYFIANETHMNGVNHALELLDRIAGQYLRFAALSDFAESAFYHALVDSIVGKTGLVIELQSTYNADKEIAADIQRLNLSHTSDTAKPMAKFISMRTDTLAAVSSIPAMKPQSAKKEFNRAMEQANHFISQRDFSEACAWITRARELKDRYRIAVNADFEETYLSTLTQAVEQLVNKAIFHLWTHNEDQADSLYEHASVLFNDFYADHSKETGPVTQMQQFLYGYQSKKQENACADLRKSIEETETEFYRQTSYGNLHLAAINITRLDSLLLRYRLPGYKNCKRPMEKADEPHRILDNWTLYSQILDSAFQRLHRHADTLGFIKTYLASDSVYRKLNLQPYTPSAPTLFSRLSASGDLRSIFIWLLYCIEIKDMEQVHFLQGYLHQKNYRTEAMDRVDKKIKKIH